VKIEELKKEAEELKRQIENTLDLEEQIKLKRKLAELKIKIYDYSGLFICTSCSTMFQR